MILLLSRKKKQNNYTFDIPQVLFFYKTLIYFSGFLHRAK